VAPQKFAVVNIKITSRFRRPLVLQLGVTTVKTPVLTG
jgi:hypothetical protein